MKATASKVTKCEVSGDNGNEWDEPQGIVGDIEHGAAKCSICPHGKSDGLRLWFEGVSIQSQSRLLRIEIDVVMSRSSDLGDINLKCKCGALTLTSGGMNVQDSPGRITLTFMDFIFDVPTADELSSGVVIEIENLSCEQLDIIAHGAAASAYYEPLVESDSLASKE